LGVVMSLGQTPSTVAVAPWTDVLRFAFENGVTAEEAFMLVEGASWLLTSLTYGSLTAGGCWTEDYSADFCKVRLRRVPVAVVYSVHRVDSCGRSPSEVLNYCMLDASLIGFGSGCGNKSDYRTNFGQSACGCGSPRVRVQYRQANNLPPGAASMARLLAEEGVKASRGESCMLPDRIQTITRQGISWTVFDPQDFLEKGGTGISTVDLWLSAANKTTANGARVYDPTEGMRLTTLPMPCAECVGGFEGDAFTSGFDGGDCGEIAPDWPPAPPIISEVAISNTQPTDPSAELWYEPDVPVTSPSSTDENEVYVGTGTPPDEIELWYEPT
jgi:hypothetical protein